jgi:Sulfotransferase family
MTHIEGNFFICIGAQKAGTRWLHDNLCGHPDVWLPYVKELHYFDGMHIAKHRSFLERLIVRARERAGRANRRMSDDERTWRVRHATPAELDDRWYASLFEDVAGALAFGEITPEYAMLPEAGFAHIARLAPQAKLIFIMRAPAERVWSHIRFKAGKREDHAILRPQRALRYSDTAASEGRTRYERTIEQLEMHFPPHQVLYLFYEDIAHDGLEVLRQVTEFLGVNFDARNFPQAATRLNVSMTSEMPAELRRHLQAKYAYLADVIESKIGRVPDEWRAGE